MMDKDFDIQKCIRQTNPKLYDCIQKWGCFFVSCLVIAQSRAKKYLSIEQYNKLWIKAHNLGYMENNYMRVSEALINLAFEELKVPFKAIKIGTFKEGKKEYSAYFKRLSVEDQLKYGKANSLIQKIETKTSFKTHFRVVDNYGNLIFDPYLPSPTPINIFRSDLYHIFNTSKNKEEDCNERNCKLKQEHGLR